MKGMVFFFSSVSVVEKKVNENDLDDDKDGEVEIKEGNSQGKKKMFWPAISYSPAIPEWRVLLSRRLKVSVTIK